MNTIHTIKSLHNIIPTAPPILAIKITNANNIITINNKIVNNIIFTKPPFRFYKGSCIFRGFHNDIVCLASMIKRKNKRA